MSPKCIIPESQKRGSVGESEVEARLKSFSQVLRPQELQDVALDFYCRLLVGNTISNKSFWVQAKATKSLKNVWTQAIERETISFWLNQVSPVFVVVYNEADDSCYWLSVEDNRDVWMGKLLTCQKSITVRVDKTNMLQKGGGSQFIRKVESDNVRVSRVQGIPRFVSSGYVGFIPVMKLSDVERARFSQTVRLGLDYLIYDSWLRTDLQEAYSLGKILATFDLSHYDHFLGLARTCVQLGKIQEAKENYDKAIEVCNADRNWNKLKSPNDASIEDIVENLEKEKVSLPQK